MQRQIVGLCCYSMLNVADPGQYMGNVFWAMGSLRLDQREEVSMGENLKTVVKVVGDVHIVIYYLNYFHIYTKLLNL